MNTERHDEISILILEDNAGIREGISDILSEEGYKITAVGLLALAKEELKNRFYNIALVDIDLPDGSGLDLLQEIEKLKKETLAIIMTGTSSLDNSIFALNKGAFAYVQKPINIDELKEFIKNAVEIQRSSRENKDMMGKLKTLSLKDPHTGIHNYRYLVERLTSEINRAKRYSLSISVIMIDLDYFKSVNDVYGHECGNQVLKEFAGYLTDFIRSNDVVVRYGGEEFIIVLPEASKNDAILFAQRLLDNLAKYVFDAGGNKIKLKMSMGLSNFPEDGNGTDTVSGILDLADKAVLNAKEAGGNRLYTFKSAVKASGKIERGFEKANIDNVTKKISKMMARTNQTLIESIYAFAKTVKTRDYYADTNLEDTVSIVTKIAKKLKLSNKMTESLRHAATLHDIGKIGIPDEILLKKEKLSEEEYKIVKKHPQIGAEIIKPIHFLRDMLPIILHHHDRYDGVGNSSGLKGKDIPLGARIIAIIDVYQALISNRPYRKAYGKEEALEIIKEGSRVQFDPDIVKVFLEVIK